MLSRVDFVLLDEPEEDPDPVTPARLGRAELLMAKATKPATTEVKTLIRIVDSPMNDVLDRLSWTKDASALPLDDFASELCVLQLKNFEILLN